MHADEATEHIEKAHEGSGNKKMAAYIAALAMLLALTALGGSNAAKDQFNENIAASDAWNFYQAKSVRQTQYRIAADTLDLQMKIQGDQLSPDAYKSYEDKIKAFRATVDRYESEPSTGEGKKELMAKAKSHEEERDTAGRRDPWFDVAEALLQIAIVLASVSAIIEWPALIYASIVLAAIGCLSTANGFMLLI